MARATDKQTLFFLVQNNYTIVNPKKRKSTFNYREFLKLQGSVIQELYKGRDLKKQRRAGATCVCLSFRYYLHG